jgi:uncharacterized protein
MTTRCAPAEGEDSHDFWNGIRQHRLILQQCAGCDEIRFPPMHSCPKCGSVDYTEREVTGRGVIYSWITAYRTVGTLNDSDVPCTFIVVELDEGCRLVARLVPASPVEIGSPVSPAFVEHDGWTELAYVVERN